MITFVGGSKFAKGGPNPLANMDSRGSISASGFGPGGPNPGGSKSARTTGLRLSRKVSKVAVENCTLWTVRMSFAGFRVRLGDTKSSLRPGYQRTIASLTPDSAATFPMI